MSSHILWVALLLPLPCAAQNSPNGFPTYDGYTSPYATDAQLPIPSPGLKKGIALSPTGQQQCYDAQAYNMEEFGWWYSWRQNVTTSWANNYWECGASTLGETNFVPMIKNNLFLSTESGTYDIDDTYGDSPYLFGFNEPYGDHESNPTGVGQFTAASCTTYMQSVIAKAESYSPAKLIIAPTINPKGSAMNWYMPFKAAAIAAGIWSKFTYMSMHYYTCDPKQMLKGIDEVYNATGLPIWVTEFNCDNSEDYLNTGAQSTAADNLAYMQIVLPMLEAHPKVVRYSWYTNRNTETPQCALMDTTTVTGDTNPTTGTDLPANDPTWTTLGTWYNNYAFPSRPSRHPTGTNTISGNFVLQSSGASLLTSAAAETALSKGVAASIPDVTETMVNIVSVTAARRAAELSSESPSRRLNTQATVQYTITGAPVTVTSSTITSSATAFTSNINTQLTAASIAATISSTVVATPTVSTITPVPTPAPTPAPPTTTTKAPAPPGVTTSAAAMSTDLFGATIWMGLLLSILSTQ